MVYLKAKGIKIVPFKMCFKVTISFGGNELKIIGLGLSEKFHSEK